MKRLFVALVLFFCFCQISLAQQPSITVSGYVFDEYGPLPGVCVIEEGTLNGTLTDLNGFFTIQIPSGSYLRFTCFGFIDVLVGPFTRPMHDIIIYMNSDDMDKQESPDSSPSKILRISLE